MQDAIVNLPGHVDAWVKIGGRGRPDSVKIEASAKILGYPIEFLLRHSTEYSAECSGETVHFTFTYVVEGEVADILLWKVQFRPPDHFMIVSRPLKPIVETRPK